MVKKHDKSKTCFIIDATTNMNFDEDTPLCDAISLNHSLVLRPLPLPSVDKTADGIAIGQTRY